MNNVVVLHPRPRGGSRPKTRGSTLSPSPKRLVKTRKCLEAIKPLTFQLETAVLPTPASLAASRGPPIASITSVTDASMPSSNPRSVDSQEVHDLTMEESRPVMSPVDMDSKALIGLRLRRIREHFGINESQESFGRRFGVEKTAWSNYETGARPLPVHVADRICHNLGLSLDWIYRGNGVAIPPALLSKIELPHQPPQRKRA